MVAHRNGNTGPNSRIDIGLNGIGKNSIDLAPPVLCKHLYRQIEMYLFRSFV